MGPKSASTFTAQQSTDVGRPSHSLNAVVYHHDETYLTDFLLTEHCECIYLTGDPKKLESVPERPAVQPHRA